jgi:cob(I)alamin adenosyltransferase
MTETPHRKKPYEKPTGERRGLLIINTGDGKGKTTAAIGLAVRAHGRGKSIRFFQFMKVGVARFGEHRALEQLGIALEGLGDGFSWKSRDLDSSAALARAGWVLAAEALTSGEHFLVVLDELTYPLLYGWIDVGVVVDALRARPAQVHVVITGRRCPAELIAIADTVTEMNAVKHAFSAGIPAQQGIEH